MSASCGTARTPAAISCRPAPTSSRQATYADGTKGLYTLLPANVDSVALGQNGGEMKLNLAGIGAVPLSQVQIIGQ